ncbi:MAG: metal ABC transporter solute-binding protein, Zn/Mn family [Pseudomonadales bacterium]
MNKLFRTLSLTLLMSPALAHADQKLEVVTSFSVLADMTRQIGAQHIELTNLVAAQTDAHAYQPTPADIRTVASADVLIVNGLGFEGWMEKLHASSGFKGEYVVAALNAHLIEGGHHHHDEHREDEEHREGVEFHEDGKDQKDDAHHSEEEAHADSSEEEHHDEDGHDPHAWHSLSNAPAYVNAITEGLIAAAPEHAASFRQNRDAYLAEIEALAAELKPLAMTIPAQQRKVITSHDAFAYLGREYGLEFLAPQGLSTASSASAADIARIIEQLQSQQIKAVFVEGVSDARHIEQIAAQTGAKIGATLYADALSREHGPASSYLAMMRHNLTSIVQALR